MPKRLEEAGKWLSGIAMYHYDKQSEEYANFMDLFTNLDNLNHEKRTNLRNIVIDFASNDPRLKVNP